MKLKPKKYEKKSDFNTNDYLEESGLIAQEMYYETPELRYLINILIFLPKINSIPASK